MVNKNIVNVTYPMQQAEDQLESMSGSKVFSTLDLTKGYNQMKQGNFKRDNSFFSPQGLYQWKVLLMGMKTSGAVFHCLMDWMLRNLQTKCAVVYIADITILAHL